MLHEFAAATRLPLHWEIVAGNRARGRNAAIQVADADVIAVTDVNVLEPHWFERIVDPLVRGEADVVAGWYEPIREKPPERAVGRMEGYSLREDYPGPVVPPPPGGPLPPGGLGTVRG